MSYVTLEGLSYLQRNSSALIASNFFNTNDTYICCGSDRYPDMKDSTSLMLLCDALSKLFKVNILLNEYSANNYCVHIGDFDEDTKEDGRHLFTFIFELEPLVNAIKVPPMPEMS